MHKLGIITVKAIYSDPEKHEQIHFVFVFLWIGVCQIEHDYILSTDELEYYSESTTKLHEAFCFNQMPVIATLHIKQIVYEY